MPELRGFRVLRLDNRGAGLSDAPDEAFSIEQMADDVAAVMDAAGMSSAHVYGASMGGLIAQELAIRYPERVLSLVLGATYAGGPPLSRAVRVLPLLLSRKGPEDLLRATAPFLSATPIPATDDPFPGHVTCAAKQASVSGASWARNCATAVCAVSTRSSSRH